MGNPHQFEVELVEHSPGSAPSGIGRYTRELYKHLLPHTPVRLATQIDPPLTRSLSFLHHLPIGVLAHRAGNIVHFMEDMGCSQMLWSPVRPAIATSHDLGMLIWAPEAKMHRPLDRFLIRLSYLGLKCMDAVIAVSEFSRRMLITKLGLPAERVHAVHSGIDTERFRPVAGARRQLASCYGLPDGPEDKYLLYVGTEIPRKNLTTLLKALSCLPENVRLLKAGASGGEKFRKATNRASAEMGVRSRVIFFDQISEEVLTLLYCAADVYVCCSYLEGFGHPVLEAMACGTPVVCSNVSSLPEIAGDAAVLIPPGDDKAVVAAVLAILGDKTLREQLAARGMHRATAFSWERTAEAVAAVYQRVRSNDVGQV